MSSDFTRLEIKHHCSRNVPSNPGIYRFLSDNMQILYVGASSNLQKRVAQHLINKKTDERRHRALINQSSFIEYRCFPTSKEAFNAEETEIWVQQPPFNRRGVHAGTFSYLVVRKLPHPHIMCFPGEHYDLISNKDKFFRINLHYLKLVHFLGFLRRLIPLCLLPPNFSSQPCWENQLGLCTNQCRKKKPSITQILDLLNILSGEDTTIVNRLEESMDIHAKNLEFEEAKKTLVIMDTIKTLQHRFRGQGIWRETDQFTLAPWAENNDYYRFQVVSSSKDKIILSDEHLVKDNSPEVLFEETLLKFVRSSYLKLNAPPKRISVVSSTSVLTEDRLKKIFQPWLKRYFMQDIIVDLVPSKKDTYIRNSG